MRKVLVLAVHPDDETLGCAGTLLKHKAAGDQLHWVIATTMTQSTNFSKEDIRARKEEIKRVASMYGFKTVTNLMLPTTKVDRFPLNKLVGKISKIFKDIKPDTVYLPFMNDAHSDHRKIFDAANSVTKVFRNSFIKRVYMMETPSETEYAPALKEFIFVPNYFVDISDYIRKKVEILKVYKSELGKVPFPRSIRNIKSLAISRGTQAGCNYAEAFMLLKEIWS